MLPTPTPLSPTSAAGQEVGLTLLSGRLPPSTRPAACWWRHRVPCCPATSAAVDLLAVVGALVWAVAMVAGLVASLTHALHNQDERHHGSGSSPGAGTGVRHGSRR